MTATGTEGGFGPSSSKKEILLAALGEGMVMLHLDGRAEGVVLPDYLRADAHVRLDLSYEFRLPDLEITERGVHATLSFQRQPFTCDLPWSAVFAFSFYASGRGVLFPDDVPDEIRAALLDAVGEGKEPPSVAETSGRQRATPRQAVSRSGRLHAVPVEPEGQPESNEHVHAAPGPGERREPPGSSSGRPILRLVK